jgi:hypothetical protein
MAKTKQPAAAKSKAKPGAVGDETVDGELIGITIWRLRPASAGDDRVLVQRNGAAPRQYALERATAGVLFEEGQLLRISAEAPREYDNYLYVVDREIYENGAGERLGEPNLIFLARSTPRGGMGKQWTKAEQEADEGKRKLVQSDPLPQTIYSVRAKRGGCALAAISLRIAQLQQGRMGQGVRGEDPAPAGRRRGPVSGADVDRLVAQLVRIRELDKTRFEEILATPIKETDSNGSWAFHEFEISHGPFAKGELRLEVGARRALLSLFPPKVWFVFWHGSWTLRSGNAR